MSATQSSNNNTKTIAVVCGLLVLLAAVAYVFGFGAKKTTLVTDHGNYYPEKVALFMEVAPGDQLAAKVLKAMDTLQSTQTSNFHVSELYSKDFEPSISMGLWDLPANTTMASRLNSPSQPPTGSFLFIINTKPGVTLDKVLADMELPKEEFTIAQEGDASVATMNHSGNHSGNNPEKNAATNPVMGLHKNHLIFASSKAILDQSLKGGKDVKHLLDNEAYKKALALLPGNRQGSFLAASEGMQGFDASDPKMAEQLNAMPEMKKYIEVNQVLSKSIPLTVSSLVIDGRTFTLDSYSPVDLTQIKDEALRNDFKKLLAGTVAFDLPSVLPESTVMLFGMSNLSNYLDLYRLHMASENQQKQIADVEKQLKVIGLDLQKNVLACLEGKFGFSILSKEGKPDFLLFLNANENTHKSLDQLTTLATAMGQAEKKETTMGTHTVTLLATPQSPIKIAFGDILKDTMAIGTSSGVENIFDVEQKKSNSLESAPLYKELTKGLPKKVNGFFYLNMQEGSKLVNDLYTLGAMTGKVPSQMPPVMGALENILGVAGASYPEGDRMVRGHFVMKLNEPKVEEKKP